MKSGVQSDLFGFLPVKLSASFNDVKIEPVPDFDEILEAIVKDSHQDGFMYPPLSQQWRVNPKTLKKIKRVPRTKRPAHIYRVPYSHQLTIVTASGAKDLRTTEGGFLIHLLGYLYGVRLQFHDWWVDGRMPVKGQHNISLTDQWAAEFLSEGYRTWKGWNGEQQKLMTNILFMHSRALSYEWDWERFMIEYMVFDGCCRLAKTLNRRLKLSNHVKQMINLCKHYGIPVKNEQHIKKIVRLRNGLFHSTLWGDGQPCTAVEHDAFRVPYDLRRLNQRVIPALLGSRIHYIQTPWWLLGTFRFR